LNSKKADANVACPQNAISVTGENQRIENIRRVLAYEAMVLNRQLKSSLG
jgi:hypothetical protein